MLMPSLKNDFFYLNEGLLVFSKVFETSVGRDENKRFLHSNMLFETPSLSPRLTSF